MRLKSELYEKQQENIRNKLITILDLERNNPLVLYELDNNVELQQQIMSLIPEIRAFFSFNDMVGVSEPHKTKRPYFCIIKYLLKPIYNIINKEFHLTKEGKRIRTVKYYFTPISF
jgi:hypothetical protein